MVVPSYLGDTFWDPQWMLKTADSTEPYVNFSTFPPPYMHTFSLKGSTLGFSLACSTCQRQYCWGAIIKWHKGDLSTSTAIPWADLVSDAAQGLRGRQGCSPGTRAKRWSVPAGQSGAPWDLTVLLKWIAYFWKFYVMFSDHGWLWITETMESETTGEGCGHTITKWSTLLEDIMEWSLTFWHWELKYSFAYSSHFCYNGADLDCETLMRVLTFSALKYF